MHSLEMKNVYILLLASLFQWSPSEHADQGPVRAVVYSHFQSDQGSVKIVVFRSERYRNKKRRKNRKVNTKKPGSATVDGSNLYRICFDVIINSGNVGFGGEK